ncbi:hypothetical protein EYF80_000828 [Liparis tanakae]|uniref:Uncharacterized protein n=1 Tax=Liparis tanakae TaxID=230148 RepID=A0A4Z2JFK3_9TELE|nr:hypothetical protein EYF80_000828 [Liparis tanakae]
MSPAARQQTQSASVSAHLDSPLLCTCLPFLSICFPEVFDGESQRGRKCGSAAPVATMAPLRPPAQAQPVMKHHGDVIDLKVNSPQGTYLYCVRDRARVTQRDQPATTAHTRIRSRGSSGTGLAPEGLALGTTGLVSPCQTREAVILTIQPFWREREVMLYSQRFIPMASDCSLAVLSMVSHSQKYVQRSESKGRQKGTDC